MAGRFAGVGFRVEGVPTRWGNQLNGNIILPCGVDRSKAWSSPHSLGKSIEWKL